jgi:hypothetical protein
MSKAPAVTFKREVERIAALCLLYLRRLLKRQRKRNMNYKKGERKERKAVRKRGMKILEWSC